MADVIRRLDNKRNKKLKRTAQDREDERQRNALTRYLSYTSRLNLPGSCHRILSALFAETIQKQRKETEELSKSDLQKMTNLPVPTQDRSIARLKRSGWISSRRIANGGTVFTITIPKKGSLFDLAGPNGLRMRAKPQK